MYNEAMDKYLEQERMFSFEGESGYRKLTKIVELLGYGKGFMQYRAVEEFLCDNPGAINAIVEWIGEWTERNSEWEEAFESQLPEEVPDDEEDE